MVADIADDGKDEDEDNERDDLALLVVGMLDGEITEL